MTRTTRSVPLPVKGGLIACAALLMVACQSVPEKPPVASAAQTIAQAPVLRQDAFSGIYEITTAQDGSVFIATLNGADNQSGGIVQRLDARTLETVQSIQVQRRAYALGLNEATHTLYVGNTREGSLSVIDTQSGIVKGRIQLAAEQKNDKGEVYYAHTRKVIVDAKHNRVFVTSPGQPGLIWIVDGATNTVTHTLTSDGIWTAGAAYDEVNNVLYVSQGGQNEILAINPDTGRVVKTFSTGDSTGNTAEASKHFFINLAIDTKGQRLFATDANTNQVYVADLTSGQFIQKIAIEGAGLLDVAYSAARNEIYTSSRGVSRSDPNGSGSVTVVDGAQYTVKRSINVPVHPNSLAVSPNGQTLYVTVKAPRGEKHPAWHKDAKESVVRIDLAP